MQTLTTEQAKEYTLIINKSHPEWGVWRMNRDNNGWVITNERGSKMLWESEFHFWDVLSLPIDVMADDIPTIEIKGQIATGQVLTKRQYEYITNK